MIPILQTAMNMAVQICVWYSAFISFGYMCIYSEVGFLDYMYGTSVFSFLRNFHWEVFEELFIVTGSFHLSALLSWLALWDWFPSGSYQDVCWGFQASHEDLTILRDEERPFSPMCFFASEKLSPSHKRTNSVQFHLCEDLQ